MSEHEESAESDPTIPGLPAGHHDTGPSGAASTRRQRAAKVAGAATSRTAGWMVAAALAGSLVTLLLDGETSQAPSGQVAFRNVGRAAPAPAGGRRNWQIPAVPMTPDQVYAGPGGPLAGGMVAPACVFAGPGMPPGMFRHARSITIHGRRQVVIRGKGHRISWTVVGRAPAWKAIMAIRPGCQWRPLRCGAAAGVRVGKMHGASWIKIKRHGRIVVSGPGARAQRRVRPKARQRVTVRPAGPVSWVAIPSCAVYFPGPSAYPAPPASTAPGR